MARVAVPVVSRFMRRMAVILSAIDYVTLYSYRVSAFGVLCARAALADEPKRGV